MGFYQDIIFRALTTPGKAAIVQKRVPVNYAQFARGILAVAAEIRKLDLPEGSICAVVNGTPLVDLTMTGALQHLGMASLYVGSLKQLESVALPIRMAFVMQGASEASATIPTVTFEPNWLIGTPDQNEALPQRPDRLAHVCLSSGTTGRPKAIGFTNQTIARRQMVKHFASSHFGWDKMLCVTGLGSSLGFGWANFALSCGKTVYFEGQDVGDQFRSIPRNGIEFIVASVKQAAALVNARRDLSIPTPSLKSMMVAGGVITPTIASNIVYVLCPEAVALYGSTETGPSAFGPMRNAVNRQGWTGVITPWTTIQILDDDGRLLGPGHEGTVRVATEGRAYFLAENGGIDTGDGWHYPGDRGVLGTDFSLCITGRTDELINSGGVKISPDAIDATLQRIDDIADCASVARLLPSGVNEIALALALGPNAEKAAITSRAIAEVKSAHGVNASVYFVDHVPRNAMGKVERRTLAEALNRQAMNEITQSIKFQMCCAAAACARAQSSSAQVCQKQSRRPVRIQAFTKNRYSKELTKYKKSPAR